MTTDRLQTVPMCVVMATRNRPAGAVRAAASILRSSYADFRLTIVDQSHDRSTIDALQATVRDPRVTLIVAPPQGAAAARNLGVAASDAAFVAFTDDDCEVMPEWLSALAAAFGADPAIAMIFGTVQAAVYDRSAGFIPAYQVRRACTASSLARKSTIEGIGANMAIRRDAWESLGGFDEALGAGTDLRAAEETDFAIRVLAAGCKVHETPAAVVTHLGFRSWGEAPQTVEGYMVGLGATYAKMLRLVGVRALQPLGALGWRWLTSDPVVDLNHRPPRFARLAAFLHGARIGWRCPLDEKNGRFRASTPPPTCENKCTDV